MPRFVALALVSVSLLSGCARSQADRHPAHPDASQVVAPASDAQRAALLGRVKSLAGAWEMTGPDGQVATIVFGVTAAGSAVREVMFPGTAHEMTNMYHMDGASLLVTHYCASGNQPRMRASAAGADRIDFEFESITNMTGAAADAMSGLSIVWIDPDHIQQEWRSSKEGKHGEPAIFDLRRRKE